MNDLTQVIAGIDMAPLPHRSRIHALRSFSRGYCFVKRDDELGFGVSGTKVLRERLKTKNPL
jgi:1-aminocyclopropane-1-carboxylate deaminase